MRSTYLMLAEAWCTRTERVPGTSGGRVSIEWSGITRLARWRRRAYLSSMSTPRKSSDCAVSTEVASPERQSYLRSLRKHGRVVEAPTEETPLPAGATHVLVKQPGAKPRLVEKRKSFF